MTTVLLLQKILRRVKNFLKYAHARITRITYKRKVHSFSRQQVLQFQRPAEKNVWIEIPTLSDNQIAQALAGKITIFGHTTQTSKDEPRWHHDLRLPAEQNPAIATTFSFDIAVKESDDQDPTVFGFDIKYPWERTRFQHLLPLGKAFKKNTHRSDIFDFFTQEIESWITHNPYLQGPCWMNAMEVGIRATNLIWLISFFYTEQTAKTHESFWNSYLTTLLEHAQFIANYWEDYDAPNNHYLLNLTGSWYLARFFALHSLFPFGNLTALWQRVCQGFNQQLNDDGTQYESSTAYHGLVIQSLQHLVQLNLMSAYTLTPELSEKLSKGSQFLADSFAHTTNTQVKIGDDDCGCLVWPLTAALIPDVHHTRKQDVIPVVRYYPDFGVVFVSNNAWHISLRTKSFQPQTPTGHAHADILGITVTHKVTAIITDPGSGCYTANASTRNKLRTWNAHSTLWQEERPRFDFSKLFSLGGKPIATIAPIFSGAPHAPTITAQYSNGQILFTRSIKLDSHHDALLITDSACSAISQTNFSLKTTMPFTPKVDPVALGPTTYEFVTPSSSLIMSCKKTAFILQNSLFSEQYGSVVHTKQIVAESVTPYHDCIEIRSKTQTSEI